MTQQWNLPIQRIVGVLLTVGGVWHTAAPWLFGYSAIHAAVISNVASGSALALLGIGYVVFRGARVLNWIGAAIGIWVLMAPHILGVGRPWLAMLEASWGGFLALALIAIAAYDLRFNRPCDPHESSTVHT